MHVLFILLWIGVILYIISAYHLPYDTPFRKFASLIPALRFCLKAFVISPLASDAAMLAATSCPPTGRSMLCSCTGTGGSMCFPASNASRLRRALAALRRCLADLAVCCQSRSFPAIERRVSSYRIDHPRPRLQRLQHSASGLG